MIVPDFSDQYGIRIASVSLLWPEFQDHVTGLLSCESRLNRHFRGDPAPPADTPTEEGT